MRTVFVGLSGGVDSAVSAALLQKEGYNVVGAFIKIWSPEFLECTWKEDRLDALRVAAALQIPFVEIDLSAEYKREVVADMLENYAKGVTPNPDVLCNRSIKFGHFARWAYAQGADMIATGHYARIIRSGDSLSLLRGLDTGKDQSYFLYQLGQSELSRALFPIGGLEKRRVRQLADSFGLPNAKRPDSQGLCFVGDVSLKDFLGRFIKLQKGAVLDESGTRVGTHDGAALYTIGERHGFSASGARTHYVVGVDVKENVVRVSTKKEDATCSEVSLSQLHWVSDEPPMTLTCDAQARYREAPFRTTVTRTGGTAIASFAQSRIAAPGQSLVLYDGDTCLGGGIINSDAR